MRLSWPRTRSVELRRIAQAVAGAGQRLEHRREVADADALADEPAHDVGHERQIEPARHERAHQRRMGRGDAVDAAAARHRRGRAARARPRAASSRAARGDGARPGRAAPGRCAHEAAPPTTTGSTKPARAGRGVVGRLAVDAGRQPAPARRRPAGARRGWRPARRAGMPRRRIS